MRFPLAVVLVALLLSMAGSAWAETDPRDVAAAITTIRSLDRPGRDTLATVSDGNKYVQCRTIADRALLCEAAGTLMQPSMARVLTPARLGLLAVMGWRLDPHFGNYVQSFDSEDSDEAVAGAILDALAQGYDADLHNLDIETTSIASEPCPPRNGPSQNLAGMISDAPSMRAVSIHSCAYRPADAPPPDLGPNATAADLIRVYGPGVTVEIQRLRVNIHRDVYAVFDADIGYVQCHTETEPDGFYCEAESTESWPALAAVLTDARIARLHDLGYADPGRAPNYSKSYAANAITDSDLAGEVLTILHDAYGYAGATRLKVETEEKGRR
jgi:hypothetical protein